MNLNEYQALAGRFANYDDELYPFAALAEEAGEVLGLIAKQLRGDDMVARFGSKEKAEEAMQKELGDVLWQLQACCTELGVTLEDIARLNLRKLEDRANRGVLRGSGDFR